jgi:ribonuclease P protein component
MTRDEKTPDESLEPKAKPSPGVSKAHAHPRRARDAEPSPAERPLAARFRLTLGPRLMRTSLKRTQGFRLVYRRGRWARGTLMSVGTAANRLAQTRIGIRTRKGLKGAVVRNRLKRQLRALLFSERIPLRIGIDLVVVLHPPTPGVATPRLAKELIALCRTARATP